MPGLVAGLEFRGIDSGVQSGTFTICARDYACILRPLTPEDHR
eukprot:SAG31_NODE_1844_length_7106_cov_3.064935_11_plen_43_part_00